MEPWARYEGVRFDLAGPTLRDRWDVLHAGNKEPFPVDERVQEAWRDGLDVIALTDHNQLVDANSLPKIPGLTIIQGVEWTHYQGHATFLGVDKPYDGPFFSNTPEEARQRFEQARERGALITLCHPFDENCPFLFDMQALPHADGAFDLVVHSDTLEHVPDPVRGLAECRRVLKPRGLLILETPNPENIWVATHTFHHDPTHGNPLSRCPRRAVID